VSFLLFLGIAVKAEPSVEPGRNLLYNGDFAKGAIGSLPDGWSRPGYSEGTTAEIRLVEDRSFRTGDRVLRLSHDGQGRGRVVTSRKVPLPTSGRLTITFWARSDAPQGAVTASLFGDSWNWQYQVQQTVELSTAWQKFSASGPCPAVIKKEPLFFARFDFGGPGHVDLADVAVTWSGAPGSTTDPTDQPEWIGAPGRNLLLNPAFELGWTGWTLDHFGNWAADRDRRIVLGSIAPSGPQPGRGLEDGAAFHLSGASALTSFCVPIEVGQTYTASAYFKAAGPDAQGWFAFISTNWKMHSTQVRNVSSDRWERRSFTFQWTHPLAHPRGHVRIDGQGLLIDRVQLEKGALSDFEPPPVTLGLDAGEKNFFVRNRDLPRLTLRALPSQAVGAAYRVVATAKDAWGRTAWERDLRAKPGRTIVEVVVPPEGRLGAFEVALRAIGDDGRTLGIGVGRYAVIDPPAPPGPDGGLFGLHHETATLPAWLSGRLAGAYTELGIGWNRFFFNGGHAGIGQDREWIEAFRKQLAPLNRLGIRQIGCVGFFPEDIQTRIVNQARPDPEALREYGEHLRGLVGALRKDLRYWEILNEANLWNYAEGPLKGQRSMPPEKYIEILKVAHAAIKGVDRDIQVVGVCMNGTDWNWLRRFLELGGGRYMDLFSFHSYRSAPDAPGRDTYPDLLKYRALLDEHGFTGPMINTEQYFAANLFQWRGNDEEVSRGYYVSDREERRAAARTVRNYIHHAAAGVPFCAFAVGTMVVQYGGGEPYFLYHLFPAYNATTRFLSNAGRGRMVPMGAAMRAFLFPDATDGPLVTLNASTPVEGMMRLPGAFEAFDFNGNPLTAEERAEGIPLRFDPVYVRFPRGTDPAQIEAMLLGAEVLGLGAALDARLALTGTRELTVFVANRRNRPLDGTVRLETLPSGWQLAAGERTFQGLAPGATARIAFALEQGRVENMGAYEVAALVQSGEDLFLRPSAEIRPVFARRIAGVRADGDLTEWRDADWIALGDAHLSRDFGGPERPRSGDADLSARVAFGWHGEYFAFAAEVTDDRHVPADAVAAAWQGDSIQVYFDQRANASPQAGCDGDDIVFTLAAIGGEAVAYLDKAGSERYIGEANLSRGVDREVRVAVVRRGGKTLYEALFPKEVLPETNLTAGSGFGFSLIVNDYEGEGRKVGLTLSPKGTEPWNRPHGWRSMLLLP
jgi:hypothetical protein